LSEKKRKGPTEREKGWKGEKEEKTKNGRRKIEMKEPNEEGSSA